MLIIGWRLVAWGAQRTPEAMRCRNCGAETSFIVKKGMRFITLFFLPVIPLSGVMEMVECPRCRARYRKRG